MWPILKFTLRWQCCLATGSSWYHFWTAVLGQDIFLLTGANWRDTSRFCVLANPEVKDTGQHKSTNAEIPFHIAWRQPRNRSWVLHTVVCVLQCSLGDFSSTARELLDWGGGVPIDIPGCGQGSPLVVGSYRYKLYWYSRPLPICKLGPCRRASGLGCRSWGKRPFLLQTWHEFRRVLIPTSTGP